MVLALRARDGRSSLVTLHQDLRLNLGARPVKTLPEASFPDAGPAVREHAERRPDTAVDVLLVNPPSPDGGIWIRTQHRVGRRSREEMVWPQCSLAQLAAMLDGDYTFAIVDAIAERMDWEQFESCCASTCRATTSRSVRRPR